jgi:IrrE N-terminal-like domain
LAKNSYRHHRSDEDLELYAQRLRRALGVEFLAAPDIQEFVERLEGVFPGFRLITVPDKSIAGDEAFANCEEKSVTVRESIWKDALRGAPRARMTIFHEIAHIALGHTGYRFRRTGFDYRSSNNTLIKLEESEAKRFAGMLAAPFYLISDYKDVEELIAAFKLSMEAAQIRLDNAQAIKRKESGAKRPLPEFVRVFLEQRKALGHPVKSLDAFNGLRPSESLSDPQSKDTLYESTPCSVCGQLTVLRRGSDVTCDSCGSSNGCGC